MELPSATVRIDQSAGAASVATKLLTVFGAVPLNADCVPWMVGNAGALYTENGYSPAADFVASYISETKKPVLFVPLPIAVPGVVGRFNTSGNTNTSAVSVAVGAYGSLDETDGAVRIKTGGVKGTDQIVFDLSLDGGRSWKEGIRLGTASTYTIPYVGLVITFGAGSLTAGQTVLTWKSTAPMWDNTGLTAGKVALQAQMLQTRGWLVIGDLVSSTVAGYVKTAVDAYETESDRYTVAKCSLKDRLPYAVLSHSSTNMTGAPTVVFADNGGTGDTITRGAGSWASDGFHNGCWIRVASPLNTIQGLCPTLTSALILTLGTLAVTAETTALAVITAETALTFVDGGSGEDQLLRTSGSWLSDGYRVGDSFTITGSNLNNVTATITAVTESTINVVTATFAAEVIGANTVTMVAGQTKAQHLIANNAAFAAIADDPRVDLGHGRAFKLSPFLGFYLRRSVQWADTIRAFSHDVHVATWEKDLGALPGWSLEDPNGTLVEHDERIDSGALAAGFTCFRTWGNGPRGAFIARSVTRAAPNTVLSATENIVVANLAQTVAQMEGENTVGQSLVLNLDNTATGASLATIKQRIDSALSRNLLANVENEGQRASLCYVTLASDDDLSGVDATLNGVITLVLLGKIAHLNFKIRVNPGA